jgi:hypothetical protein
VLRCFDDLVADMLIIHECFELYVCRFRLSIVEIPNETIFFANNFVRLDHVKFANGCEMSEKTVIVNVVFMTSMDWLTFFDKCITALLPSFSLLQ